VNWNTKKKLGGVLITLMMNWIKYSRILSLPYFSHRQSLDFKNVCLEIAHIFKKLHIPVKSEARKNKIYHEQVHAQRESFCGHLFTSSCTSYRKMAGVLRVDHLSNVIGGFEQCRNNLVHKM
jgi:hypothetical protein